MKTNTIIGFFVALSLVFLFSACEKIDEPIDSEVTTTFIPWGGDTSGTVEYVMEKKVLLQEFTGHTCVNCPKYSIWAHDYSAAQDHRLIIIAVHAGWFATPAATPLDADFRTPMGNEIHDHFTPSSYPSGLIDMAEQEGNYVVSPTNWEGVISAQLAKTFTTGINVEATINSSGTITSTLKFKAFETPIGKYKTIVCVVGDTIAAQDNGVPAVGPSPLWEDYQHQNVLIGSMNGTWGQYINPDNENVMVLEEEYSFGYTYDVDPAWADQLLHVIAYVYDEETYEVIQVEEAEVVSN